MLKHPAGFALADVAFSPQSQKLATAVFTSSGDTLYVWDLSTQTTDKENVLAAVGRCDCAKQSLGEEDEM